MKKILIVIVFTLFFAPVLLAVLLHSQWVDWRPPGTRNHGELISPVITLPEFSAHAVNGENVRLEDLADRWHLVHVAPAGCDAACLETLYWLRQVRTAQDRHQPHIGLMLLTPVDLDADSVSTITALAADFRVISGQSAGTLLDVFPDGGGRPASYILDPDANIIMGYADNADPTGIRRDLRRLLTWTRRD